MSGALSLVLYFRVQTGTKNKPIFSCLCLWGGAFSRNLYFRVQAGTKTNLFNRGFSCLCFWGGTCTSGYKQAPHKPILQGFSCLCLLGGECAFSRILYSGVQTGAIETRKKKYLPIHRLQITGTSISVQVDL